jgi:hypothetical protein
LNIKNFRRRITTISPLLSQNSAHLPVIVVHATRID